MAQLPDFRRRQRWGDQRADELNELVTVAERADKIMAGPGIRIRETPIGKTIENAWRPADAGTIAALVVGPPTRFKLVGDDAPHIRPITSPALWRVGRRPDYVFAARLIGEEEEPTEFVRVAKSWDVRKGPWQYDPPDVEDIDNITYEYEATNANWRTAFGNVDVGGQRIAIEEKQEVILRWLYFGEILAVKPVGGTGVEVDGVALEWQELPGRAFTRMHNQAIFS